MKLEFTKYHGLGNDFLIFHEEQVDGLNLDKLIPEVCDRHSGIGADGFIIVKKDPLEMVYYNQDGSRAPMCGNGIRCFAKFCHDEQVNTSSEYTVETLAGQKIIHVNSLDPFLVDVDMGYPLYDTELLHIDSPIWNHRYLSKQQTEFILYSVFLSTVHTVVFVKDINDLDIETVGKEICMDPLFKEQTNVNFVQILDSEHIKVKTYERGCGVTLACGTGCCASALVANKEKKCQRKIDVELEKGHLEIELLEDDRVMMRGPAEKIAKGEINYETN